jgi:hypothetical protein
VTDDDAGIVVAFGSETSALVVTAGAVTLRRSAGPVAWSALELLALSARLDATGALVVTVGVRDLAAQLGVGRDAAAKSLSRLRELGVISASQQRAGGGRFDGTRYTVLLPVLAEPPSPRPEARSPRPRRAPRATSPTSLSLFDDSPDTSTASLTDVTDVPDSSSADHSTQVPEDLPKKLHELAFNRMPTPPDSGGSGSGC